jgi:VIT1/CCC1 family predicted Fe2+/Mn2+ transporter
MASAAPIEPHLGRALVLDELFDLSLYQALRDVAPAGRLRSVLDRLIPVERRHVAFWQDFFGLQIRSLDPLRRTKLALIVAVCRVFGAPAIHLVLEAIEVYGVRKYLAIWQACEGGPFEPAVREVLQDEFEHEDELVTGHDDLRIRPGRVRDIFLGLNDGLVEIVGAVSGFFGAFGDPGTVLIAGSTTAVAGALSMAAGAFVATSSESEVRATELARQRFLGESSGNGGAGESPLSSAAIVGASYCAGALVPMLPIALGAHSALPSVLSAGAIIIGVSIALAFLSGMRIRRRVLTNLLVVAAAAAITYGIGIATKVVWDIAP